MRVIVAIEDASSSSAMVDEICRRSWDSGTEFRILKVIEPLETFELDEGSWACPPLSLKERRVKDAQNMCGKLRAKLQGSIPAAIVHYEIREGSPKSAIIESASEWSADKIIVGSHGRSICPRFLLGSTSRAVAALAPCSVEVIRSRGKVQGGVKAVPALKLRTS